MLDARVDIIEHGARYEAQEPQPAPPPQQQPQQQQWQQKQGLVNLLTHNRPYDATGSTACICASPPEVHFRGFVPGQPSEQVLQLRNVTDAATRVVVVPPIGRHFQVQHLGGHAAGRLAAGLTQQLVVRFTGDALRHYTDAIHVHTEGGGLLVPLHAYPVMSSTPLPSHIHLRPAALAQPVCSQLLLTCETGVPFDFAVTLLRDNPAFVVAPLSGTVPAHGCTAVRLTFTPTRLATEHLELQVQLSEFNAQPMRVRVTGSAPPGLVRQRLLGSAAEQPTAALQQQQQQQQQQHTQLPCNAQQPDVLGGAGSPPRGQGVATAGKRSPGRLAPLGLKQPPRAAITQHDVNSLLNQRPGRLQVKDIKAAIVTRKHALAVEHWHLQDLLARGAAAAIDPLDQPDVSPRLKEALFQMQLRQADASARCCTGLVGAAGGGGHIGSDPPSAEEVQRQVAARHAAAQQATALEQERARHRLQPSLSASGAVHALPICCADSHASSSMSSSSYPDLEGFTPRWLLLADSNDWRKRVQVLQRFVNAVRVVICRNRAQARLRKLRVLAARVHTAAPASLAGEVLQELLLEGAAVQRPGMQPALLLLPERVDVSSELPATCPGGYQQHAAVAAGVYADYSALQPQQYTSEFQYKLLGYEPEPYHDLLAYVPLCKEQPLLPCPAEEGPVPCGVLPDSLARLCDVASAPADHSVATSSW